MKTPTRRSQGDYTPPPARRIFLKATAVVLAIPAITQSFLVEGRHRRDDDERSNFVIPPVHPPFLG